MAFFIFMYLYEGPEDKNGLNSHPNQQGLVIPTTTYLPPEYPIVLECNNGAPDYEYPDCCINGGKGKYCCTNGANNSKCIRGTSPPRTRTTKLPTRKSNRKENSA
jgi:hypothetical protein